MPKQVTDIRFFVDATRSGEKVEYVKIYKAGPGKPTKFKMRHGKYLHTLVVSNPEKAKKLTESIPPAVRKIQLGKKNKA